MKGTMRIELSPEIFQLAQGGDPAACTAFVEYYQSAVFSMLSRMLRPNLVEDAAQDVFLKVFRGIDSFTLDGPAKLSTWILTIASRVALDVRKKRSLHLVPIEDQFSLAGMSSADERVLHRQADQEIEDALDELPDAQRIVLVLSVFQELSHARIAEILAIDVGTVKSRLSRARKLLRTILNEEVRHVG